MKYFIRLFFVIYLFFASACVNIADINHNIVAQKTNNAMFLDSAEFPVYKNINKSEKSIAPSTRNNTTIILSTKNDDTNSTFETFRGQLTPENRQFSLLLSYLYNKSYLENNFNFHNKQLLSEISPNAP